MKHLSDPIQTLAHLAEKSPESALEMSDFLLSISHPRPTQAEMAASLARICKDGKNRPQMLGVEGLKALLQFCGPELLHVSFKPQFGVVEQPLWDHLFRWLRQRQQDGRIDGVLAYALEQHGEELLQKRGRQGVLLHTLTATGAPRSLAAFLSLPSAPSVNALVTKTHPILGDFKVAAFNPRSASSLKEFIERGGDLNIVADPLEMPLWAKAWRELTQEKATIAGMLGQAALKGKIPLELWHVERLLSEVVTAKNAEEAFAKLKKELPDWANAKDAAGMPACLRMVRHFPHLLPQMVKEGMSLAITSSWGNSVWLALAQCERAPSQKTLSMLQQAPLSVGKHGHGLAAQQMLAGKFSMEAATLVFELAPTAEVMAGFTESFTALWFKAPPEFKAAKVETELAYVLMVSQGKDLGKHVSERVYGDVLLAAVAHCCASPMPAARQHALAFLSQAAQLPFELDPRSLEITRHYLASSQNYDAEPNVSVLDRLVATFQEGKIAASISAPSSASRVRL